MSASHGRFEDGGYFPCIKILMFACKRGSLSESFGDLRDHGGRDPAVTQARGHAEIPEKAYGAFQGFVDGPVTVRIINVPDPAGELEQFVGFTMALVIQQGRHDYGEGSCMVDVAKSG
jgi:hypothetical protein